MRTGLSRPALTGALVLSVLTSLLTVPVLAQQAEPEPALAPPDDFSGGLLPPPAQVLEPLPEPVPDTPPRPEVSWSGRDWVVVLTSSLAGTVAGMIGGPALAWHGLDLCSPAQDVSACLNDHPASVILLGLSGAALGGGMGASIAGTALGYHGSPLRSLALAAAGTVVFAVMFQPTARLELEEIAYGGAFLVGMVVPLTASLGYYISQDNPAVIGGSASLIDVASGGGWRLGVPAVAVEPGRVGVQVLGGTF